MTSADMKSSEPFELVTDGAAFRRAVGLFERWIPRNQLGARAALWLDGGNLVIRVGNDEARVPATGTWPGIVASSAGFLIGESSGLPETGNLRLSVDGDRLRVKYATGSRSGSCRIRDGGVGWPPFIEQLTPFTMLETLLLPRSFSAASIEYSGLTAQVQRYVGEIRDVIFCLDDAVSDVAANEEIDAGQVREVLAFLVGPGLDELMRRKP